MDSVAWKDIVAQTACANMNGKAELVRLISAQNAEGYTVSGLRSISGAGTAKCGQKMKKRKTKLFSITADDCQWDVFRGSGNGGQKKQKTSSGVRCTHEPSGAVGKATDSRDQSRNRVTAFTRMVESAEFKVWLQLKIDAAKGELEIEETSEQGNKIVRPLRVDEI